MKIAIISAACRFPGANTIHQFWDNLWKGKCSIEDMPAQRWQSWSASFPDLSAIDTMNKKGGFLKNIHHFDPAFFQLEEEEAYVMDPQQRLGLELAYETLHASNWENHKDQKIGVAVGITYTGYADLMRNQIFSGQINSEAVTAGNLPNFIASRISNRFDLKGPSIVVDTACSSSLSAINIAINNIKSGQCDLALAGGVFLLTSPSVNVALYKAGAISKSEVYRIFDEKSDGILLGEGGGFILLKPYEKAIADGDIILGIVRNISLNNDGKSASILAPRASTQQALLETAYKEIEIVPSDIHYLETHGTGTRLGDATEARSMSKIFHDTPALYMGSVKANIGHLMSVSGIASVIKALGILIYRTIPPLINFEEQRKNLPLKENINFNTEPVTLDKKTAIKIGVNSFGFGGTNAHLVLEENMENKQEQKAFKQLEPPYNKKGYWFTEIGDQPEVLSSSVSEKSSIKIYRNTWKKMEPDRSIKVNQLPSFSIFCHAKHLAIAERIQSSLENTAVTIEDYSSLRDYATLSGDILFLFPENYQLLFDSFSCLADKNPQQLNRLFILTQNSIVWNKKETFYKETDFLLSGVCFAALSVFPQWKISQVDFSTEEEIIPAIIPLLYSKETKHIILYRDHHYWTRHIAQAKTPKSGKKLLKKNGVYWITGGAGGIGVQIAKTLVKKAGNLHLLFTGRKDQKQLSNWEALSNKLAAYGASLDYFQSDITKEKDIQALFDEIDASYGKLDGIIHAAGVQQIQAWEKIPREQLKATLAPKVEGTQLIKRLLDAKKWSPDFVVTFSSIASSLPNLGKGISAYVIANSFLDQYTQYAQLQNPNWKVINWGLWDETGLNTNKVVADQLAKYGLPALNPNEASELFNDILTIEHPQLLVFNHTVPLPQLVTVKQVSQKRAVEYASTFTKTPTALANHLQSIIAKELDMTPDEIGLEDNLLDLGLDSLMAMELAIQLESLGFEELPFEFFYDFQSISEVVKALEKFYKEENLSAVTSETISTDQQLPLSPAQIAFVKAQSISEAPNFSFIRLSVKGTLDPKILSKAIQHLTLRHPVLRTKFQYELEESDLRFYQIISEDSHYKHALLEQIALKTGALSDLEDQFVNRPFELKTGPLFRFGLVTEGPKNHLLIALHHSIADGWSQRIIAQDIFRVYQALYSGQELQWPVVQGFLDWIPVSRDLLQDKSKATWWKDYALRFPDHDKHSLIHQRFRLEQKILHQPSACINFIVPAELCQQLELLSKDNKIPLQIIYQAHYAKSLSTWLNHSNLLLSIADINRSFDIKNIRSAVGCFAETYPLLVHCDPAASFISIANKVQTQWERIKPNTPFDSSLIMQFMKDAGKSPMAFGFSFNYFNNDWTDDFTQFKILESNARGFTSQARFSIQLWKERETTKTTVNYPKDLLSKDQLEGFKSIFLKTPKKERSELFIPDPTTDKKALKLIQNEVIWQIRNHATYHPSSKAIITETESINFKQLEQRVARLAGALAAHGLTRGDIIGFVGSHSEKAIISLLAVWRLGGVWLPLDKNIPSSRLEYMLSVSEANFLIFETQTNQDCPVPLFTYAQLMSEDYSAQFISPVAEKEPIYIVFTSGTSGQPKAIPIAYPPFANNLSWFKTQFDINAKDEFVFSGSISFDATIRQIILPLQVGASIHVLSKNTKGNASLLRDFTKERKITVWHSVPSLFEKLLQAIEQVKMPTFHELRLIMLGGEALPPQLIRRWQKLFGNDQIFINLYGPTETTINVAYHVIYHLVPEEQKIIPIGTPIWNAEFLIVDEQMEIASTGELLIAGPILSSGYLNQMELTKEKFIWFKNKRYYRTGDKVSKNESGDLLYLGRVDRQIKIRGIRLEPLEIEYHLLQIPGITNALVDSYSFNGTSKLAAAIETSRKDLDLVKIKKCLTSELPPSLLPQKLICLETFPLLPNEKIDLAQLKKEIQANIQAGKEAPMQGGDEISPPRKDFPNSIEKELIAIWKKILDVTAKSPEDAFFDLGGDSLNAMVLFLELEKAGWKNLPTIADFTKDSRLSILAKALKKSKINTDSPLAIKTAFSLNPAQLGFYYSSRKAQENFAVMKSGYYIDGKMDPGLFKKSLDIICQRHIMLQVKLKAGTPPKFVVVDHPYILFQFKDLSQLEAPKAASALSQYLEAQQKTSIDIQDYPLIRMLLLKVGEKKHLWYIIAHHVLADGVSSLILGQEILQVYDALYNKTGKTLPPLKNQFPDYVKYLENLPKNESKIECWVKQFEPEYTPPKLPVIQKKPKDSFLVLQEQLQDDSSFGRQLGAAFVLCFYRTLIELAGQEDILIGIPSHGRPVDFPDIHRMIGSFALAHPLRINNKNITLKEVFDLSQEITTHELPVLKLKKELSYSLPVSTLMGSQFFCSFIDTTPFLSNFSDLIHIDWSSSFINYLPSDKETDILLFIKKCNDQFILNFTFTSKLFSRADAKKFIKRFKLEWKTLNEAHSFQFQQTPLNLSEVKSVDSMLIGYLPSIRKLREFLPGKEKVSLRNARSFIKPFFPNDKPQWLEYQRNEFATTGYLALPLFAEEIQIKHSKLIIEHIKKAITIAEQLGAKTVALAGQLATVTGYGKSIKMEKENTSNMILTTGHQSTVVGVAKTVVKAIETCEGSLQESRVAFIGLGSVGSAVLTTLLRNYDHPGELLLFDLPNAKTRLEALVEFIRDCLNFKGSIHLYTGKNDLQANLYHADIVVSAISGNKMVIDVDRLKPGTIIVDDSFPHCFDETIAKERMKRKQDVLILGGGLFNIHQFERRMFFPIKNQKMSDLIQQTFLPNTIAGCQFESVLLAKEDTSVSPTIGPVDYRQRNEFYKLVNKLDIDVAPLHLGNFIVAPEELKSLIEIRKAIAQTSNHSSFKK